ncbi:MAG: hypothetical protein BWX88_02777 [Planctomycetes bacterium ADurb.Bin126]|nr:MAG: hypothetical protein BWX88_02777 [Planctomycetes bacterium ADurb.Bin126]HOD79938.1 M48 family metalloprotease [Phycisphaerae bacterium]HQL73247.1 M48 family metalloprotease [Phycisphaerae bacterium]
MTLASNRVSASPPKPTRGFARGRSRGATGAFAFAPVRASAPAWARLALTAAELLFLLAAVALERQVRGPVVRWLRGAGLGAGLGAWPAYYAALLSVAGAAAYLLWMWAITCLVRMAVCPTGQGAAPAAAPSVDNPAEAHLGEAVLIAIALLIPYALVPARVWIVLSVLLAGVICMFDLRDLGRLLNVPAQELDEHRMASDQAQPLRQLAAEHGLERLNLVVAPPADDGEGQPERLADQPALAQYIPTRGRATFVFTRSLVKLLDAAALRAVFAHELAHWRLGHSRKTILAHMGGRLACVLAVASVLEWMRPAGAATLVPTALLLWALTWTLATLLLRAYMRRQERQAHAWAVQTTGDPGTYVDALERIAGHNGYREPTWLGRLLDESPSPAEVVHMAGK